MEGCALEDTGPIQIEIYLHLTKLLLPVDPLVE